ncbi:hypothetical protein OSTOST_01932, partial [Ostertagia ostertagi]
MVKDMSKMQMESEIEPPGESKWINATGCDCQKEAEVNKTREHLRLVTRISALKLLPTVREAIYQIEAEKLYVLQRAKYDVMKDMRAKYGNWLAQTDILTNMDVLIVSMQKLLNDNRTLTAKEIFSLVNASVTQFHTNVLPSAFLCFALGTCRTASAPYMECLRNNVQQWVSFFGDEPLKMAYSVADAIWQYRKVDAVLQALHNSLITAEDEITVECAHRFHNVTVCPKCLTDDTVSYCRGSCISASYSCLGNLSKKWEANIDELYKVTRRYDEGFIHLVHGISNGMQRLVQTEAPRLAKVIVNKCGPLLKENVIYMTSFTGSELQKPQELKAITKELVEHVNNLTFVCFSSSRPRWAELVLNVTMSIVLHSIADANIAEVLDSDCQSNLLGGLRRGILLEWHKHSENAADELSLGIKDVRPRPKVSFGLAFAFVAIDYLTGLI